ncbi:MAG: TlpA family protein disulfide reductase [Aquificaceae bacterium]|nr:TlpA family protein disulfide reductase [Aquificaceae bacterium]
MPYIIAGALLLIMLFFGLESKKEDVIITSHVPASGQTISELAFKTLDGRTLKLSELRGKVVLINFWATWCPPCKEEMPIFEKEYKRCKDKGLEILAVNMDSSERALSEFLKEKSYSFKVVRPTEELEKELKLMGFPTSYLLDREGKVYRIKLGVYRELEKDLKQLLGC